MRKWAGSFFFAVFGASLCACDPEFASESIDGAQAARPGSKHMGPRAALAAEDPPPSPGGCVGMTVPEENHASIRLRVGQPASGAQLSVDEQGKIAISGVLHKHASMIDVSDEQVVTSDFMIGPPPDDVAAWAVSWTTNMRPPHLGANQLCARANRDPHRSARILRSFTVVDLIPPSSVPDLTIGNISATGAKATWGTATDNYGLAGYVVTVDGGTARRTTVGTRSFTITGLTPSTRHTVSVVAIDLAGNTSTTPATASFTTAAEAPPPSGDFTFDPQEGGATASWHPDVATDVTYRAFLDGEIYDEFPLERYCTDAIGNPASPCTAQNVISYPIEPLEEGTPYTWQIDAVRADGTQARSLSGSFSTTSNTVLVSPETVQLAASESSRCTGMGGDFYVAEDVRAQVPIPAGSTQVFPGCYNVPDSSCLRAFLSLSGNRVVRCADDLTRLLFGVAPPGRGPVITSLDDIAIAATADGPGIAQATKLEPITWCTQDGPCILLVGRAPLVLELVEAAPLAVSGTSAVVVTAGGIGLGLGLFALYEILFPGEIGFGGFIEFPIDFDDNFDTFTDWGLDEGKWISDLKLFAEVVETTNQLAARHGIPFVWNHAGEGILKEAIDLACATQRGVFPRPGACTDDEFAVYVPGSRNYRFEPMRETGEHIVTALGNGGVPQPPTRTTWFYPGRSIRGQAARSAGFRRGWFDTAPFQINACTGRPLGDVCDEFPFWSTDQAVNLSGMVASLKPVPRSESLPQARDISGFYRKCRVTSAQRFIVLPVKPWVDAGGPSFAFRVSKSGASLCMAPGL
jgi:hypothetical protein